MICRAYSSQSMPVSALVKVACRRWTIEESFAASKELAALDQHQAALRSVAGSPLAGCPG